MNLQYNIAAELVAAFFAWTSWDRLAQTSRFELVPKELREWKNQLDRLFPSYSLEQAQPLASEFLLLIFSLLKAIVMNSISTPKELLAYLSGCSGTEFAGLVVEGEGFPFSLEELLNNPEKGKEALNRSHGTVRPGEADRFVDFLGHPDYYRNTILERLTDFYKKAFAPYQKDVTRKMKNLLKAEIQAARENPGNFLETRLFINKAVINKEVINKKVINTESINKKNIAKDTINSEVINGEEKNDYVPSVIFLSYYDCLDCLIQDNPSFAMYGWMNKETSPEPNIEEIYSLITDETRRNILKALAQKAMFSREIAETWNLSPSTVSYHMNRFYMLGLIRHRSGPRKRIYHELNKERLSQLIDTIKTDLIGTDI